MIKLYTDCESDAERAEYFRDGSAWEAGIIAQAIQSDVADAFQFRAEVTTALKELRDRVQVALTAEKMKPDDLREEIIFDGIDFTITKLGLAPGKDGANGRT